MEMSAVDMGSIVDNMDHIQNTADSIAETVVETTVLKKPQQPGRQLETEDLDWPED